MELKGEVTTGLGKGKYYMSKEVYQKVFDDKLGFKPFPGTLNLKVEEEEREKFEENSKTLEIRDVYEDGERLSNVDVSPCKIEGVECGLLNLEFTDHPYSIAEVVAPIELREKFNLEDGDKVKLRYEK
jgi:riboflavin kinase